jgi:hypothetical protein
MPKLEYTLPHPSVTQGLRIKKQRLGPTPRKQHWPDFTIDQILSWADAHHARTGQWPIASSGPISESPRDKWKAVDTALRRGLRGLDGGSSLAQLLAEQRDVRNRGALLPLTCAQIVTWADAYHACHGRWPQVQSGPIPEAPGETWRGVESALQKGVRGLPGGSSLATLLSESRGLRNSQRLPDFTFAQILAWADSHHQRMGRWPIAASGPIPEAPGETWNAVHVALQLGCRGLPGGLTLARLLAVHRGVRHRTEGQPLSVALILTWADAHHQRTGEWPTSSAGPIRNAPGETWGAVHTALQRGCRGLPGGSSLPRLLAAHRGVRNRGDLPRLTEEQILVWADAYHAQHGRWPPVKAGPIAGAPGESWGGVNQALEQGLRGLPGGSSLHKLIRAQRG